MTASLKNLLTKSQFNIRKLVRTIVALRSQYSKIHKIFQEKSELLKNPNLYSKFLELEESLLDFDIITIEDIKYMENLDNPQKNQDVVRKIIIQFMNTEFSADEKGFIQMLIDKDNELLSKQKEIKKLDFFAENKQLKADDLGHCLIYLSEIAKLPFKEINGKDFLDDNWKKILEKTLPHDVKEAIIGKKQKIYIY